MAMIGWVALGGAMGAAARYGLTGWVHGWAGSVLPWGTLAVNAGGSFFLGLTVRYLEFVVAAPELRAAITVGFLGAFTTFSTYSYETVALLQERAWGRAAAYAVGSLGVGVLFVVVGLAAGRLLVQR